jgi:hypothetical protein
MSDVAGYLSPAGVDPIDDAELDDFLGDVIAAITGLDRNELVRPRWQEDPPALPSRAVTWCGVGVMSSRSDVNAYTETAQDGLTTEFTRHASLTILASFYGPQAGRMAGLLQDGLQVDQNQAALLGAGFASIETIGPVNTSELIKEKWLPREDVTWIVRREIRRTYPVLSLLSANGELVTTLGTVAFGTS